MGVSGYFPGDPLVMISPSSGGGAGSVPHQGAKNPHASWPKNQNIKQKQYCNKFNKDFINGPHKNSKINFLKKFRVLSKEHRSQLGTLGQLKPKKHKGVWGYDPVYKINTLINGRREKHLMQNYSR